MPFALPKLHRPTFVKQAPELNALTSKGRREANAAINDARPPNLAGTPPHFLLGQYRARVSVLREITGRQTSLVSTLPAELPEPTRAPATQHTSPLPIIAPATQQPPTLPTPTAETLDLIVESALAGDPSMEDVTRLRTTSPQMRERVDAFMRRPDQRELACRMTRNSITRMANSPRLNDEQFRAQVTHLIGRNKHIGFDLGHIDLLNRRQIVLDCLAVATHLRTVDLDTDEIEANFPAVLAATTALSAANPHLIRLQLAVRNSHIGAAGAQAPAANAAITTLNVRGNDIGDAGVEVHN